MTPQLIRGQICSVLYIGGIMRHVAFTIAVVFLSCSTMTLWKGLTQCITAESCISAGNIDQCGSIPSDPASEECPVEDCNPGIPCCCQCCCYCIERESLRLAKLEFWPAKPNHVQNVKLLLRVSDVFHPPEEGVSA